MADEDKLRDDHKGSPDSSSGKTSKLGVKGNKAKPNRIMYVVTIASIAVLLFIVLSLSGGDSVGDSKTDDAKKNRIIAAQPANLFITQRPAEPDDEDQKKPEFILSSDGTIQRKDDDLVLQDPNDGIKNNDNVKIVMKEPSQEYQNKRSSLLTAMASTTALNFTAADIEDDVDDRRQQDPYGRPTDGDLGSFTNALLGRGGSNGMGGGGMGFHGGYQGDDVAMQHQVRNVEYIRSMQGDSSIEDEVSKSTRRPPIGRYELKAGTVISGVLTSGINSELPGTILAQVSENIYDSPTGAHLLIPQGAKVLGEYDSHVVYGQNRILVVWKRIIYPDGSSLNLGGLIGSDQAGYSGLKQKIDNHYSRMIGAALFASVFIAAGKIATENDKDKDGKESTAAETIMEQMSSLGARLAERNLNVAPTLRILPGFRFSIITTKDMAFSEPYYAIQY